VQSRAGVENLFFQLVIHGLKPGARALVIVPDGLLLRHTEESLKRHLLNTCHMEAIISLPKNTFYSTPKKTYILVFRKKLVAGGLQEQPVFTYLVGSVGETLDAKRFTTAENDLPRMAETFRLFQGAPSSFIPPVDEPRLKIWPIQKFKPEDHWMVDRWWTEDELRALGAFEGTETISPEDLSERLREVSGTLAELADLVTEQKHFTTAEKTKTVSLADKSLFRLSIGKRVTIKELRSLPEGPIPLYSANVTEPFGYVDESLVDNLRLIDGFTYPSVLWGIDGDFMLSVKEAGVPFAFTDHCGRMEILDSNLDASYCRASLALARAHGFDRTLRPSLTRMRPLSFDVPVREDGSFDLEAQKALASRYDSVVETLKEAASAFVGLVDLEPDVMLPTNEQETT
jgi:type I restriction enzyme M protein